MLSVASYPIEILQTPGQVTIITEAFSEVRRVYMDQPQQPIDEVPPGYYGHSVGRWEKDTLVIDTVGIKECVPGYQNMPHSDKMRITERIRMVTPDVLHTQITIDDPVVLEKPVTYTLRLSQDAAATRWWSSSARTIANTSTPQGKVRMRLGAWRVRSDSWSHDDPYCFDDCLSRLTLAGAVVLAEGPRGAGARRRHRSRPARWRRRTWRSRGRSRRST